MYGNNLEKTTYISSSNCTISIPKPTSMCRLSVLFPLKKKNTQPGPLESPSLPIFITSQFTKQEIDKKMPLSLSTVLCPFNPNTRKTEAGRWIYVSLLQSDLKAIQSYTVIYCFKKKKNKKPVNYQLLQTEVERSVMFGGGHQQLRACTVPGGPEFKSHTQIRWVTISFNPSCRRI